MKPGFDAVGIVMGLLTIPMALLGTAGAAAGLLLAIRQDWTPFLFGFGALLLFSVLAPALERLVIAIDDGAERAVAADRRGRARAIATISGALPVLLILLAEVTTLSGVLARGSGVAVPLAWLWGYAAATGPWTLFAARVSRFRRTLVGIRAYAGHIALWLFSLLDLRMAAPMGATVAAMLLPSILPFTVGLLLALSDREAIANVRV